MAMAAPPYGATVAGRARPHALRRLAPTAHRQQSLLRRRRLLLLFCRRTLLLWLSPALVLDSQRCGGLGEADARRQYPGPLRPKGACAFAAPGGGYGDARRRFGR